MPKLYKSEFDSNIFGVNVYKIHLSKALTSELSFDNILRNKKIDVVFCTSAIIQSNLRLLEKYGFSLISIRATYILYLKEFLDNQFRLINTSSKDIQIISGSERTNITRNQITEFAGVLLPKSRYSKDEQISKQIGMNFFTTWIENSLYHHYAEKAFMAIKDSKIIGLVTVKIRYRRAYLDLICVFPKYQKLGVGKLLLLQVIKYLLLRKIEILEASTQGENIQANIFYQRNRFILKNIELDYHKHFNWRRNLLIKSAELSRLNFV